MAVHHWSEGHSPGMFHGGWHPPMHPPTPWVGLSAHTTSTPPLPPGWPQLASNLFFHFGFSKILDIFSIYLPSTPIARATPVMRGRPIPPGYVAATSSPDTPPVGQIFRFSWCKISPKSVRVQSHLKPLRCPPACLHMSIWSAHTSLPSQVPA